LGGPTGKFKLPLARVRGGLDASSWTVTFQVVGELVLLFYLKRPEQSGQQESDSQRGNLEKWWQTINGRKVIIIRFNSTESMRLKRKHFKWSKHRHVPFN
jgi:hypothetical protein